MGLFWAIVAMAMPGVPQLLHFDLIKALIIWAGAGAVTGTLSLVGLPIPVGGMFKMGLGLLIGLYNLYTALQY